MTDEQATEIQEYLEEQLELNGFGLINQQIAVRITETLENINQEEIFNNKKVYLLTYIQSAIGILDAISSHNLAEDIQSINANLEEGQIEHFELETLDGKIYNLKELPDYQPITEMLQEVLEIINS